MGAWDEKDCESKDPDKRVGSRLNDEGGEVENNITSHFPVKVS